MDPLSKILPKNVPAAIEDCRNVVQLTGSQYDTNLTAAVAAEEKQSLRSGPLVVRGPSLPTDLALLTLTSHSPPSGTGDC
jgi:hypothetical protein